MRSTRALLLPALLVGVPLAAQTTSNPFPEPIAAETGVVRVNVREFAAVPDIDGQAARMMLLVHEPGSNRIFVNDMRGPLYSVGTDGRNLSLYLDINEPRWNVGVQAQGRERGFQSFAFHPQFAQRGTPGFGKFYTYTDTNNNQAAADYRPGGGNNSHHTVLLEWTAVDPAAARFDGGPPREVIRFEQPYPNHNAGHIAFRPGVRPGEPEFGLLYVGVADGGSGGDPLNLSQNLGNAFGKLFRIDPLGRNSPNGKYGIPVDNPFVSDGNPETLGEIYAYGLRNPQRFAWDPRNGNLFLADIGQNVVEKLTLVPKGANLGWNVWEGSFRLGTREVDTAGARGDRTVTYPVAEYDQSDPLLQNSSAVTGVHVYRTGPIQGLRDLVLFGDFPSGEIFYVSADDLPQGGQSAIRRVLFNNGGQTKTLLQLIQEKNTQQGKNPATRADLRFGAGPDDQVFILNKADGTIRVLVP
jgi:glucose/arabinose dehydrogenase